MVCFQTKNPNLGKFWRVLQWKMLVYFMDPFTVFCYILWTFGTVRGNLAYIFPFWYFVPRKIWQPWCSGNTRLINRDILKQPLLPDLAEQSTTCCQADTGD
jgi:hypothetical protein